MSHIKGEVLGSCHPDITVKDKTYKDVYLCRVIKSSVDKCLMKYKYINRKKMKSNFEENIKIYQGNRSHSYFSIYPPFAFTTCLNLSGT